MSKKKKFSAKLKEQKFDFEKSDGTVVEYTLRELIGDQLTAYMDTQRANVDILPDGKTMIKSFNGMHVNLLSRTVYDENDRMVPPTEIIKWPATMVQELFEDASKLSGLDKKAKEESKKESPEIATGGSN